MALLNGLTSIVAGGRWWQSVWFAVVCGAGALGIVFWLIGGMGQTATDRVSGVAIVEIPQQNEADSVATPGVPLPSKNDLAIGDAQASLQTLAATVQAQKADVLLVEDSRQTWEDLLQASSGFSGSSGSSGSSEPAASLLTDSLSLGRASAVSESPELPQRPRDSLSRRALRLHLQRQQQLVTPINGTGVPLASNPLSADSVASSLSVRGVSLRSRAEIASLFGLHYDPDARVVLLPKKDQTVQLRSADGTVVREGFVHRGEALPIPRRSEWQLHLLSGMEQIQVRVDGWPVTIKESGASRLALNPYLLSVGEAAVQ